jgi:cytidine deaminase
MQGADALVATAREARERAHAPYSHFRVGCALEAEDGSVWTGCNIENASYGMTMCAERVAVGCAVAAGRRAFRRILLVSDSPEPATPCGACRQVLAEFAPGLDVYSASDSGEMAHWKLEALLPSRFTLPVHHDGGA